MKAAPNIERIVIFISRVEALSEHNETVKQIEKIFRTNGFYTTREYPIFRIRNGSWRAGRIDLVARKGKYRVAIEYDHHMLIKWKSFQKMVQIKPDVAIAISGRGEMKPNFDRAIKYIKYLHSTLHVVTLKEKKYEIIKEVKSDE